MTTIKNVAEKAGVTVTTVSRVLNNRGYISEVTRKKVSDVIWELKYQPNDMARNLAKKSSNTIGVMVPHINDPYFSQLISCIVDEAAHYDYRVLLYDSKEQKHVEEESIKICSSNKVIGLILCGEPSDAGNFDGIDVPIVTIQSGLKGTMLSISSDDKKGGYLAAQKLISKGRKKLLYMYMSTYQNRQIQTDAGKASFIDECRRQNIEFSIVNIEEKLKQIIGDSPMEEIDINDIWEKGICTALEHNIDVDGIFACNDLMAAHILRVCRRKGISIPDDLSLVSYEDSYIASLLTPMLSSVNQPIKDMAKTAVNALQQYKNGEIIPVQIILPVTLIDRESA